MRLALALSLACYPAFAQGKPSSPSPAPAAKPQPLVAATDVAKPWPMAQDELPTFPPLSAGTAVEGGMHHEIVLDGPRGPAKLWIYVPKDTKPKQAPCVLVAPAGSNLLFGMTLGEGDRPEHLPWLQAGFVVVAYEIDGVMPPEDQQTDANVMRQIRL